MRTYISAISMLLIYSGTVAQVQDTTKIENIEKDLLYIEEVQARKEPGKVLHAEPLYVDLIRDLGARRGEKEWNFGIGMTDNLKYDTYEALIEYEFAPADRLGLEVELPVTIYAKQRGIEKDSIPGTRIESFKTALQWSFFVNQRLKTSMAVGYINELEFSALKSFGNPLFTGNIYNPFFVVARRWGNNWHTLLYTGPRLKQEFGSGEWAHEYEIHSNLHYMISGTRNFIGVELNKSIAVNDFDMVIRPQMRLGVADNFLIGIVGGIPVNRENQRFSMFTRIIWEPGHRHSQAASVK